MTIEAQKEKIIAAINARGWFIQGVFMTAANELRDAGKIRCATNRTAVGAFRSVWVAA